MRASFFPRRLPRCPTSCLISKHLIYCGVARRPSLPRLHVCVSIVGARFLPLLIDWLRRYAQRSNIPSRPPSENCNFTFYIYSQLGKATRLVRHIALISNKLNSTSTAACRSRLIESFDSASAAIRCYRSAAIRGDALELLARPVPKKINRVAARRRLARSRRGYSFRLSA